LEFGNELNPQSAVMVRDQITATRSPFCNHVRALRDLVRTDFYVRRPRRENAS